MALLSAFLFLAFPAPLLADVEPVYEIFYDAAEPARSVGILGESIVEAGSLYQHFRIINFEPEAIVAQDLETEDTAKWLKEKGELDSKLYQRAWHLFIVKQMRGIYEAQIEHFHKFGEYAASLEKLVQQGFLAGGFEDGKKQGYHFSIAEAGVSKKWALESQREPTFLAVAELQGQEQEFYFSVDQFGNVRYTPDRDQVKWGPVWDYADHSGGPGQRVIDVNDPE